MADRKISLNELSEKVGVSNVNLSKMKNGKISAIRFSTLEAICDALDCQPVTFWNIESKGQGDNRDRYRKRGCLKSDLIHFGASL